MNRRPKGRSVLSTARAFCILHPRQGIVILRSSLFPMKTLLSILTLTMLAVSALAEGPIRHVVHFKFKKEATPAQIENLCKEFAALPSKIKEIESFEWGTNNSPEGLDKGFKHCWVIGFKNAKDRDVYLKHPAHEAFVGIVKPIVEDVLVVDFTPEKKP